jgi:hypothetical protein
VIGFVFRNAALQRRVRAEVTSAGGNVICRSEISLFKEQHPLTSRCCTALGAINVSPICDIYFDFGVEAPEREAIIRFLAECPSLRSLEHINFPAANVDQECIRGISRIDSLRSLSLPGISGVDLTPFKNLSLLEYLGLHGAKGLSSQNISALRACRSLEVLDVSSSDLDDDGAVALSEFPGLCELNVIYTALTPSGLALIAKMPNLRVFRCDAEMCDAVGGMKALKEMMPTVRIIDDMGESSDEIELSPASQKD